MKSIYGFILGICKTSLLHVYGLAYSGLCLRNSVSLFSRVHIDEKDVECIRSECEQYFRCQAIFLNKVKPTTWTIGKAIPFHTAEMYKQVGFGLGLNSMQGREAKHSKLACYAKNTTKVCIFLYKYIYIVTGISRNYEPHISIYQKGSKNHRISSNMSFYIKKIITDVIP